MNITHLIAALAIAISLLMTLSLAVLNYLDDREYMAWLDEPDAGEEPWDE